VGIIQSLEERDVREAIPFVQNLLRSPEAEVRIAALHALGRLADVSSAPLLWNMTEGNRLENRTALHAYLALAESLLKRGETANAQSLFTRYAQVALTPTEKCSALNGLAQCKPQDAENMLFEACFAPEKEVRAFAVRLLSENPSATVTQRMVAEIPRVAPSLRPILMEALAGRNGTAVRDALLEATLSQDHDLRVAGLRGILHRSDIYNTTRLQVFHRAIPVAQSDAERHTLLLGLRNIASSTSIPYLMDALGQGKTQNETWAAILVIADKIVRNNRPQEALPLYERAVRLCGDAQLVRHATQKMRQLGAKADFASQAGYIEHWWVLGALPGREKWRTLDAIPLQAPVEIQNPVLIAERQFRWRYFHLENPQGLLDFMEATPLQGNAAAYAYAEITSPSAQDVLLKVGSDDDYFLALNGVPVSRFVGNRGWKADEDAVQVRLVAGVNRILLKVLNGGGSWQASLRITDMSHQPLVFVQSTPQTRLQEQASASAPKPTLKERRVLLTSGLEYVELEEGKGEVAKAGDNVAVHYVGYIGTFPNAKRYDNTHERGEPFYFTLGNNQALAGFDQGIQGMKVGGKRRLVVPPSLAYGAAGFGKQVPPNATLTFEVELVSVEH
jgi:FKBP-type peptidyl-prolyl cis-trans isomerase